MASDELSVGSQDGSLFINPQPFLIAAMGAALAGILLAWLGGDGLASGAAALLAVGAVAAGSAVALRPRSAVVLGLAGFYALLACLGYRNLRWDSAALLLAVLMVIASASAVLVLLPRPARRAVVSVLIIVHFAGILTAVTSAPPGPWLSGQLWVYFYRPYLQFMYLNNAYHFYSPEPGPAPLLWFCIEYEQGKDRQRHWRWVKVPDHNKEGQAIRPDGTPLWPKVEYTRRLSLAEQVSSPSGPTPPELFQRLLQRRLVAGNARDIPLHPEVPVEQQYRPPNEMSIRWLGSYVRHVVRNYPCQQDPELKPKAVKIYRAVHVLMNPPQIAEGIPPNDPSLFLPFYQGEFDPDGNPTTTTSPGSAEGGEPADPFYGWLIPIIEQRPPGAGHKDVTIKNYLLKHAEVADEGVVP
jgi:hypothetical protein